MRVFIVILSLLLNAVFIYGLVKVVKKLSVPAKGAVTYLREKVTK